jgi:hypothetical protein
MGVDIDALRTDGLHRCVELAVIDRVVLHRVVEILQRWRGLDESNGERAAARVQRAVLWSGRAGPELLLRECQGRRRRQGCGECGGE